MANYEGIFEKRMYAGFKKIIKASAQCMIHAEDGRVYVTDGDVMLSVPENVYNTCFLEAGSFPAIPAEGPRGLRRDGKKGDFRQVDNSGFPGILEQVRTAPERLPIRWSGMMWRTKEGQDLLIMPSGKGTPQAINRAFFEAMQAATMNEQQTRITGTGNAAPIYFYYGVDPIAIEGLVMPVRITSGLRDAITDMLPALEMLKPADDNKEREAAA